ncbi:MAG: hypothetical protein H6Q89_1771 [Myxococcaceae bacterium]|nr:hypothetical protein [Myxococcaceae bacterium]
MAFTLWGVDLTWLELGGDLAGVASVWLLTRQNVWNWPVGLLNTVLFFVLFLQSKLYGDGALQVFFFALGVWGWWSWVRKAGPTEGPPVRRTSKREWLLLALAAVGGTAAAALYLKRFTDSPVPLADGSVLVLSLCATWGQVKKRLESWWIWIGVDVISVPLYVNRKLYPTALLYFLFGCLCVLGLREWTRAHKARPE